MFWTISCIDKPDSAALTEKPHTTYSQSLDDWNDKILSSDTKQSER
ncbi:hypothetical protein [Cupriavidus sp. CP313]